MFSKMSQHASSFFLVVSTYVPLDLKKRPEIQKFKFSNFLHNTKQNQENSEIFPQIIELIEFVQK